MNKSSLLFYLLILTGSCNYNTPISEDPSPVQIQAPSPSPQTLRSPDASKYNAKSRDYFGLYFVESKDNSDERVLIISEDDGPIPSASNDPGEATTPGFYLSRENRLDFEEVELIGKQVYFKTRGVDGVTYEFRGIAGEEIVPEFSVDVPVPFIRGTLKKSKNGRTVVSENVKFGHRVIA